MEFSKELMVGFVSPEDSVGSYYPHLTITAKGTVQCNVVFFVLLKVHLLRNVIKASNLPANIEQRLRGGRNINEAFTC
jgi:hypothetical protein